MDVDFGPTADKIVHAALVRASSRGGLVPSVAAVTEGLRAGLRLEDPAVADEFCAGLRADGPPAVHDHGPAFEPRHPEGFFSESECDFTELARLNSPTIQLIPKGVVGLFARVWGGLLKKAVVTGTKSHWFSALAFPRCVLVSPPRGGRRVARSLTKLVLDRINLWSSSPQSVLSEARLRSRQPSSTPRPASKSPEAIEKATLAALRLGDVKKALQVLSSAPFAPVCPETVDALQALHPGASTPRLPLSNRPFFKPI